MFERSLIVSQGSRASAEQRWSSVASITLQVALAGLIVGLPLLQPVVMTVRTHAPMAFLPAPKLPPVKPVPVVRSVASAAAASVSMPAPSAALTAPPVIPHGISTKPDEGPPRTFTGSIGGGMGTGLPDMLAGVGSGPVRVVTVAAAAHSDKPTRVSSGVLAGMLLAPIQPVYPAIAKATHQGGVVVVEAVISKRGTIESLRVVSGPEILRGSAMEAIRVARYQPFQLNGEPTEVQTTITVNFKLGG